MITALNVMAPKQNIQLLPTRRLLSPFLSVGRGPGVGGGGRSSWEQKEDKIALYLTALCHAQLLTPEEAVEVINTFKGGTLCSLLHN